MNKGNEPGHYKRLTLLRFNYRNNMQVMYNTCIKRQEYCRYTIIYNNIAATIVNKYRNYKLPKYNLSVLTIS